MTEPPAGNPGEPNSYYQAIDAGVFRSTIHAQGAWSADEQHMAPVSGLLVHALETCSPREDLALSRVVFDILGSIPAGDTVISARVIRPGRTIELLEAVASSGGRAVVRATAWRLSRSDTSSIAGTDLQPMPPPSAGRRFLASEVWAGGFIRSLEIRTIGERRPGRGRAWIRPTVGLIDGYDTSDLTQLFGLIDTANGIAIRARPDDVLFPNTDLTVHLFRPPAGQWLGLDTEVSFGAAGTGLTSSVLHDLDGPVGRAAQILTVRIRTPPPSSA